MLWGQGADMWGHGSDWQLINCLNTRVLRVLSQNVCLSLITRRSWGNQRSKQWHTLLRNAGPGQTTWRVPGPEESGVSCWANIASHHINIISILIRIKQDFFHIQTTDKITKITHSDTVLFRYPEEGFLSQDGQFLCMKLAWHLTRCWYSLHYAALQAVSLKPPIKTYQTE